MDPIRTQIIVPCYNEARRLPSSEFDTYLASHAGVGFIFVNDGSIDNTLAILQSLQRRWGEHVQVIDQQPNLGKAEAVRVGVLHAGGDVTYIGYFDADLATPLDAIAEFVEILDRDPAVDLVIGARVALLGRSIRRSAVRHYFGRIFATAASLVLGIPVYDTQCGAKVFRRAARARLFDRPFGSRWIFDVEMIARYMTLVGGPAGIYELPLRRWSEVGQSSVKTRDFVRAIAELAGIYRQYQMRRNLDSMLSLLSAPFVRYAVAGAVGTSVHYAILISMVWLVRLSPVPATAAGAVAGAGANYLLNYHFTFASTRPHRHTLPRFIAVAASSAALNAAGMWYATHRLQLQYIVAQVICTAAILLTGYVLNRLWTFGSSKPFPARKSVGQPTGPSSLATEHTGEK